MYYNNFFPRESGYYVSEDDGFIFTFNAQQLGTIKVTTDILLDEFINQEIGF